MASRKVTRRQTAAGSVAAAARQHAAEVAARFGPRLAAAAAATGRPAVDLAALQEALGWVLDEERRALEAADAANIAEVRDDRANRERRDRALADLRARLSRLRQEVDFAHGPGAGPRVLALRGRTPRYPWELLQETRRVVARLRGAGEPWPEPAADAPPLDRALWADRLEGPLRELEAALRAVQDDRRRRERTLRVKQEALASYDRSSTGIAALLAALYHLAALDGYERRLRPKGARGRGAGVETVGEGAEAAAMVGEEAPEPATAARAVAAAATVEDAMAGRAAANGITEAPSRPASGREDRPRSLSDAEPAETKPSEGRAPTPRRGRSRRKARRRLARAGRVTRNAPSTSPSILPFALRAPAAAAARPPAPPNAVTGLPQRRPIASATVPGAPIRSTAPCVTVTRPPNGVTTAPATVTDASSSRAGPSTSAPVPFRLCGGARSGEVDVRADPALTRTGREERPALPARAPASAGARG